MFEATLEQAALMKKILEAIKDLVEQANFDCSASGVQVQAMDSSHVSLVSMMLYSEGFRVYRCDRGLMLGIKMQSMAKILKCAENGDTMIMSAADNADTLRFKFENAKDRESVFDMKLMEIDSEPLGIPDQKYACSVKLPSAEFQRIVRDLTAFGDTVEIAVTKGDISFSVAGETGNGQVRLISNAGGADKKEEESTTVVCSEAVTLTFALRYLGLFTKATALSSTVTLMMSPDVPLVVEYPITDGKEGREDKGFIKFYLAPKIADDETA